MHEHDGRRRRFGRNRERGRDLQAAVGVERDIFQGMCRCPGQPRVGKHHGKRQAGHAEDDVSPRDLLFSCSKYAMIQRPKSNKMSACAQFNSP